MSAENQTPKCACGGCDGSVCLGYRFKQKSSSGGYGIAPHTDHNYKSIAEGIVYADARKDSFEEEIALMGLDKDLVSAIEKALEALAADHEKTVAAELRRKDEEIAALSGLVNSADKEIASLRSEVERLKAEVREWLCAECKTVYPGPPRPGFACVMCPKCDGDCGPRLWMERRLALKERDAYREGWVRCLAEYDATVHKAQMKQGEYHKAVDAEAQNLLSSEGKK